jgi:hypothetical protein
VQPVQKHHGYAVSWTLMHLDWSHCVALPPTLLAMLLQLDCLMTVWWLLHLVHEHWGQSQAFPGPDWHWEQQQKQNQVLAWQKMRRGCWYRLLVEKQQLGAIKNQSAAAGVQQGVQGGLQLGVAELPPFGLKKMRLGVGHQLAAAVGRQWQPGLGQGEGLPLGVAFAVLAEPLAQPPHTVAGGDDAKAADTLKQPHMSMHLVCCTAEKQQQLQGQLRRLAAMDAIFAVAALLLLGLALGAASAAAAAVMHSEAAAAAEAVMVAAAAAAEMAALLPAAVGVSAAAAGTAADAVLEPGVHAVGGGTACHWISDCRAAVLGLCQS